MQYLIPTPSGPALNSGAATPVMSSPIVGAPGANGHSSNIGYRSAWQQQQPRPLRPSLLQDAPAVGTLRRVKRPADIAAEQLAANVLAAHKVCQAAFWLQVALLVF